ncbi:MAG TPA: hypothetical protein VIJ83_00585 [Solirubrobacteraceae bacterium]
MTERPRPRVALLGMPRSGKSTYLGTLWAVVQSPLDGSVVEASFSGDRAYVQRLADQVARAQEVERTALDSSGQLAVSLEFEHDGLADLLIPDTSGESLRLLFEQRVWYPPLRAVCEEATSILLFVHPERIRVPQPISVLGAAASAANGGDEALSAPIPFDPREHASSAAELISVVENVIEVGQAQWPVRFAVVVSAWDSVDGEPTPYDWLQTRMPGLLSTLESNPHTAGLGVFGVSAQGGALEDRDELLAKGEIYDRVFASDRDGKAVSLTEPLRWAIWGS